MGKNRELDLRLPTHVVLYQYQDVPGEWHVAGLESAAAGWGRTQQAAFDELLQTIRGQYEEALKRGIAPVLGREADPEWIEAYRTGKHPSEPKVVVAFRGVVEITLTHGGKTPRIRMDRDVRLISPITEERLQPA